METKINIAEILKDKPQGTKLYSSLFGKCYFYYVSEGILPVTVKTEEGNEFSFSAEGRYSTYTDGEFVLFPSEKMRDWEKCCWKRGDVVIDVGSGITAIFDGWANDSFTQFNTVYSYEAQDSSYNEDVIYDTARFRKENDGGRLRFIAYLEKEYKGKYNPNTLQVEPEFKDGDIVYIINKSEPYGYISIYNKQEGDYIYRYAMMREIDKSIETTKNGYLFDDNLSKRHATESEKQQLFDALAKKGKAWDAEKKQIVDLPKQPKFKPFDKVLVRDEDDCVWCANFFSHINSRKEYVTIGCESGYTYCLPYNENTKHLLGTTDEWKGGE